MVVRALVLALLPLALALGAVGQPRGGGWGGFVPHGGGLGGIPPLAGPLPGLGGIPPLAGPLPGTGVRPFCGPRFGFRRGFGDLGLGYLGYADFGGPYLAEEGAQPQVIVVREVRDHAPAPPAPMQPKLIEVPASGEKARPQPSLPSVLVWRNGQREEVKQYVISGPFLYDYTKPRGVRRISLDDLDLDASERANLERGVKFLIPASPSEVTVRF